MQLLFLLILKYINLEVLYLSSVEINYPILWDGLLASPSLTAGCPNSEKQATIYNKKLLKKFTLVAENFLCHSLRPPKPLNLILLMPL